MATGIGKARAARELVETSTEHKHTKAHLAKLEATRDRRIVRAVAAGMDKAEAARLAGVSRQRVGQIVDAATKAGEL